MPDRLCVGGIGLGGIGDGSSSLLMHDFVGFLVSLSFTLGATVRLKILANWSRAWQSERDTVSNGVAGVGFFRAWIKSVAARCKMSLEDV